METNKIALKQMLGTKEAVTYLEDLVKSFQAGKIVVQQGDDYVDLQTPEMVDLKVEAKVKKDKSKFSLELSWRNTSVESDAAVTITSTAPAEKKQSASPAKAGLIGHRSTLLLAAALPTRWLYGPIGYARRNSLALARPSRTRPSASSAITSKYARSSAKYPNGNFF